MTRSRTTGLDWPPEDDPRTRTLRRAASPLRPCWGRPPTLSPSRGVARSSLGGLEDDDASAPCSRLEWNAGVLCAYSELELESDWVDGDVRSRDDDMRSSRAREGRAGALRRSRVRLSKHGQEDLALKAIDSRTAFGWRVTAACAGRLGVVTGIHECSACEARARGTSAMGSEGLARGRSRRRDEGQCDRDRVLPTLAVGLECTRRAHLALESVHRSTGSGG